MTREELIREMQGAAARIAKKYGLTEVQIGEDRQKGIWGEAFTKYLEQRDGPCTAVIRWTDGVNQYPAVMFDFRFSTPRIGIRDDDNTGSGAFVEVDNPWNKELGQRDRTQPFLVTEVMYWKPSRLGEQYRRDVLGRINRILKKQ